MRHYTAADQVRGCTADEARLIIDAVLPLHVKFWGDTQQDVLRTAMRVDTEYVGGFSPVSRARGSAAPSSSITASHPTCSPPSTGTSRTSARCTQVMGARTQTLVHGDVRLDNVMFGADDQHPSGAHRLAGRDGLQPAAGPCLPAQPEPDRSRIGGPHEDELVRYYFDQLCSLGVSPATRFDDCWDDYDVGVLYLLSYPPIIGGAFDPANERGKQLAEEILRRASQTVTDRGLLARVP